jgi:hypothetical protein
LRSKKSFALDQPAGAWLGEWFGLSTRQPKFTTAGADDALEIGGELAEIDLQFAVYQHDPHIKAVLLPPLTYVPMS